MKAKKNEKRRIIKQIKMKMRNKARIRIGNKY